MKFIETLKMRWIVWVWNHTPTCAEMSRLASRSLDEPASPVLRLRMRLHYLICVWCERYRYQLNFLRSAAQRFEAQLDAASQRTLSTEARRRMVHRLREECGH